MVNRIKKIVFGSAQPQLTVREIQKFWIGYGNSEEQQKIADFLTAVDTKIQQLKRKHYLMQQYKKGVMQQLFSQQVRFKDDDGRDYPDWESHTCGVAIEILTGYPFKGEEISEDDSGIPLLRGINITEGFIRHSTDMDRFFCGDADKLEKYKIHAGDLVLGMDGSKVGKNASLITENDEGALLVQRVARIRAKPEYSLGYIFQHIISSGFYLYVDRVNTSSGIPHISSQQIKDFEIPFPCLDEQEKIADFLAAIDSKIQQIGAQIEKAETFKQGLLQQMFV